MNRYEQSEKYEKYRRQRRKMQTFFLVGLILLFLLMAKFGVVEDSALPEENTAGEPEAVMVE